jgi:hypothetical protein
MRPDPFTSRAPPAKIVGMSPREVVQSRSTRARRSLDGALIGFILAVVTALALGGSGILH